MFRPATADREDYLEMILNRRPELIRAQREIEETR